MQNQNKKIFNNHNQQNPTQNQYNNQKQQLISKIQSIFQSYQQLFLECPISQQKMRDPIICIEGKTYDYQQLNKHFKIFSTSSPWTQQQLGQTFWIKNKILSQIILRLQQLKKSLIDSINAPHALPKLPTTLQTITLQNGSQYQGLCINGKPHGVGTQRFGDVFFYDGQFQNGKKHGHGKIVDYQLDIQIEGDFFNNRIEGQIEFTQRKNGKKIKKYKGFWKKGQYNGKGKQTDFINQAVYEGEWKQGKKWDKNGKMAFMKKDITLIGNFMDNKFQGLMTYKKKGQIKMKMIKTQLC